MTGTHAFGTDEARFTPITVAGILAILALTGVLASSVFGGGASGLATRIAHGGALNALANPLLTVTQPAASPGSSSNPVTAASSGPKAGGSAAAIARAGAGTVAPTRASVSSSVAGPATRVVHVSRVAKPSASARHRAHVTTAVDVAAVVGAAASAPPAVQAAVDQVLGGPAAVTTAASSGIDPMASVVPSTDSSSSGGSGSGATAGSGVPFPGIKPYTGPLSTQAEVYLALGLPADFQFGGEPDPYVVGSYSSFVRDAAAGDAAAQAGLDLAKSQGANFLAFH